MGAITRAQQLAALDNGSSPSPIEIVERLLQVPSARPALECLMAETRAARAMLDPRRCDGWFDYESGRHRGPPSSAELAAARNEVGRLLSAFDTALQPAGAEFVASLLSVIEANFPPTRLDAETGDLRVSLYIVTLEGWPRDLLAQAAREALLRYKFWPTLAEFIAPIEALYAARVHERNGVAELLDAPALPRPRLAEFDSDVSAVMLGLA